MSLEVDLPWHLQSVPNVAGASSLLSATGRSDLIILGLVNNMPDSALAGTEAQFTEVLRAASGGRHIKLRFSSLPQLKRGSAAKERMAASYWSLDSLLASSLDGVIVTGMEPGMGHLSSESYWPDFISLLQFAQSHLISSVWSCLAAHAAVLALDGVERRRLSEKQSGVFTFGVSSNDPLVAGLDRSIRTPHSRWNEIDGCALQQAGYTLLSHSLEHGVDAFVKRESGLMLFFQGHPEYQNLTLLKEYRRDVGRFLRGENMEYPKAPAHYFESQTLRLVDEFQQRVLQGPVAPPVEEFPFASLADGIDDSWRYSAARVYGNWLNHVAEIKAERAV